MPSSCSKATQKRKLQVEIPLKLVPQSELLTVIRSYGSIIGEIWDLCDSLCKVFLPKVKYEARQENGVRMRVASLPEKSIQKVHPNDSR